MTDARPNAPGAPGADALQSDASSENISAQQIAQSKNDDETARQANKIIANAGKKALKSPTTKRRFWRKKRFWLPVVLIVVVYLLYFDSKEPIVSPETTVVVEPLTPDGKRVDFRKRYRDLQDEYLAPASENGYRHILQALGPRALEQTFSAASVRWEDFPTNEKTKNWYFGFWTRLCEKFELDPATRPTFLERQDISDYLRANGVDETEPLPDPDSPEAAANAKVWIDYAEVPARISAEKSSSVVTRLLEAPWTADEFPTAARWVDENDDLYAVYEKALEAPRFGCWHFVGEEPFAWIGILLPDVQALRNVARQLKIRANYRIGKGDVDGAIADRRLILRLARYLLDNPNGCLIEHLVGLAIYGTGVSVKVGANPDALPTPEQRAQDAQNWRETFGEYNFDVAWRRAINGERLLFFVPSAYDLASLYASRRWETMSGLTGACFVCADEYPSQEKSPFFLSLRRAFYSVISGGFDGDAFMRRVNSVWETNVENENFFENVDEFKDVNRMNLTRFLSPNRRVRSEAFADSYLGLMLPGMQGAREAFRRANCVAKITTLQHALFQYQAENGSLPPAFTVDANGKPLQSWRVLILPYLGEKEKELYSKIRLDEPWNSQYNVQFQAQAPNVFQCPSHPIGNGTVERSLRFGRFQSLKLRASDSSYSVVVGPNSLFDQSGVGKKLNELTQNSEKAALSQALIVERTKPVCWTRPDAEISEELALETGINDGCVQESDLQDVCGAGIGSFHPGGANFALVCDSTSFFSDATERRYAADNENRNDDTEPLLRSITLETLILGVPQPKNVSFDAEKIE